MINKLVAPATQVARVNHTPRRMGRHILLGHCLGDEIEDLEVVKAALELLALHILEHRGVVHDERVGLVKQVTLALGGNLLAPERVEVVHNGDNLGTLQMGQRACQVVKLLHRILQAEVVAPMN